jgi:hypothetical protein
VTRDRDPVVPECRSNPCRLVAQRRAYFTRDDGRLFWVTFGATVAGTVVTVMIVAVAVLLAKSGIARSTGALGTGDVLSAILFMVVGGALADARCTSCGSELRLTE